MSLNHANHTFTLSEAQADVLLGIQHRAIGMLGRLRVLRDGSIEVEDEWAESALEAFSHSIRSSVPMQAIQETEERSGMPWSVFIGHCLSWWEGVGQPQRGGSMCMPRGMTTPHEKDERPMVKRAAESLVNLPGALSQSTQGLSVWTPKIEMEESASPILPSRSRPAVPPLPFLVILIERLGSLDLFFSGLKWNQSRRVGVIKSPPPIWPIIIGGIGAILLSGHSWWAPWPIMSIFGAGFGWIVSQSLGRKRFCGGVACQQTISTHTKACPRCGGELVR